MIGKINKKQKIYGIILALAIVSSFLILTSLSPETKAELTKSRFVQNFIHPYHSFKKLPDIFFFPYFFVKSELPKFYINVSVQDLIALNKALPSSNPFVDMLLDENKQFVKADFSSGNYKDRVDFRYRGLSPVHWNSYKKSFRINFPDNNLFNGIKSLNFIISYDRDYQVELLNMYRAKKLGVYAPDMFFARAYLNGRDMGVYLVSEHWSREWLEKLGLPDLSDVFGLADTSPTWDAHDISAFSADGIERWKSYISADSSMEKLTHLIEIVAQSEDEDFAKEISGIVDLDKFYAWDIVTILSNSNHQNDQDNMIMLFNSETEKFELIPWDIKSGCLEEAFYEESSLAKRILSIPEFRETRNKALKEYIDNEENLIDDLAFYDNLTEKVKPEFLSDSAKLHTNFTFLKMIKKIRTEVVKNFHNAQKVLNNVYDTNSNSEG